MYCAGSAKRDGGSALDHAARVGRVRAQGHGKQVAHTGFACLRTEMRQCFGGQTLQPWVRVLEQGAQLRSGGIGARIDFKAVMGAAINPDELPEPFGPQAAVAFGAIFRAQRRRINSQFVLEWL